jgi:hypothetical protein
MTLPGFRSTLLLSALLCWPAANAPAQATLSLAPGQLLEGVEFSRIGSVRELADGRVLVTDGLEKQLSVVDFQKSTSLPLGRIGDGPGECRTPGMLFALPGDTTWMVDLMAGRWLVLKGTAFAGVITANDPPIRNSARNPVGLDHAGHALITQAARDLNGIRGTVKTGAADSTWVVRVDRRTGAADSLTKMRARPSRIAIAGGKDISSVSIQMNPLAAGEQAVIFSDGMVAVARLDPYRVDWYSSKGVRIAGLPLPFQAVAVDGTEKSAVMKRMARDGEAPADPGTIPDWPPVLPPFPNPSLKAAPDGRLWILRMRSTKAPGTDYDIVDRTGKLAARLHLAPNEIVAGFGSSRVYVVTTDDDGIQHLRRHPLPRIR